MRITKVYTKTGDSGTTGLVGGQRVPKHDLRIESYGTVDELNAALAIARQAFNDESKDSDSRSEGDFDKLMEFIGNKLFTLGGDLATRLEDRHPQMPVITEADIEFLEKVCDAYNESLPPLEDFVLPGGSRTSAALHVCRTITRRAERAVTALDAHERTGGLPQQYLNRLSDALFVLSRWVNFQLGVKEVIWERGLEPPSLPEN